MSLFSESYRQGRWRDFGCDCFKARPWAGVSELLAKIQRQDRTPPIRVITGRPAIEIPPMLGLTRRPSGAPSTPHSFSDGRIKLEKPSTGDARAARYIAPRARCWRRLFQFNAPIRKKPLCSVEPPDFRRRVRTKHRRNFYCRPARDHPNAGSILTLNLCEKFGDPCPRPRLEAIQSKSRQRPVIVQQQQRHGRAAKGAKEAFQLFRSFTVQRGVSLYASLRCADSAGTTAMDGWPSVSESLSSRRISRRAPSTFAAQR